MKISEAVVVTGLVGEEQLREYARWGMRNEFPKETVESVDDVEQTLREALESEEQVEVRETDMDVLRQYLRTQKKGKLHLVASRESKADVDIIFGQNARGEYLIPWRAERIEEMITNGLSYLLDDRKRIHFASVREVFFGERKAFMVCVPVDRKPDDRP